ncbi:pentatricopeptide repeat-containing protein, mitochondrial [Trifolium repens]|nr:pentatricopeptide repeat-containing protein, mitochondrial [Trifolium repens]
MAVKCLLLRSTTRVHFQQPPPPSFFRFYSPPTSSSSLMMMFEEDEPPNFNTPLPKTTTKLSHVVVSVFKSLNWRNARKIKFKGWVQTHGFSHSINSFRIMIHTFALADMHLEVFALLRDIVGYYKDENRDAFELFAVLLDSPNHVERSVVVFDILIKVFASNSMLDHAYYVFVSAKDVGIVPNIMSCNFLFKCLVEKDRVDGVRCLFQGLINFGPTPNIHTYTIMMNFYCRDVGCSADIRRASEILGKIYRSGETPTVVTYSTYIKGLCKVGSFDVAWKLICNLHCKNRPLNNHCFNAVIHGLCQRGAVDEALVVLEEMRNSGVLPDVYSYSILIDAFCKNGDNEKVTHLMTDMDQNRIKPSIVTYTSLIRGGLCKNVPMQSLMNIFRESGASGYKYDQTIYETLIDGFCREGDMDSAAKLLEEMSSNNIVPSAFSYCSLIKGFYKLRQFANALKVFSIMQKRGIWPDTIACNHILSIYCRERDFDEALVLSEEFQEHGVNLNPYSYNEFIHKLCRESFPEKALQLLPLMLKRNVLPGVVNYSTLISGFAKQSNPKKAVMIFTRMTKVGITFNVKTYTILIDLCTRNCNIHIAYNLFEEMKDKGVYPDQIAYTTLITAICNTGEMIMAQALFDKMLWEGCSPNVNTYTCMINGYLKLNMIDQAQKLHGEMRANGLSRKVLRLESGAIRKHQICNGKLATDITGFASRSCNFHSYRVVLFVAETLGFKWYAPAYLSPQATGKNLLIGANFASAASGYDEKAAILNHAIPLSQQLKYYMKYQSKLTKIAVVAPDQYSACLVDAFSSFVKVSRREGEAAVELGF